MWPARCIPFGPKGSRKIDRRSWTQRNKQCNVASTHSRYQLHGVFILTLDEQQFCRHRYDHALSHWTFSWLWNFIEQDVANFPLDNLGLAFFLVPGPGIKLRRPRYTLRFFVPHIPDSQADQPVQYVFIVLALRISTANLRLQILHFYKSHAQYPHLSNLSYKTTLSAQIPYNRSHG